MAIVVSSQSVNPTTEFGPERDVTMGDYIGDTHTSGNGGKRVIGRGPQAFVSSYPPGYVIPPHFHTIDQFQIFTEGDAKIGKFPIEPVVVHYTDAFTPYGPIVGGPEGYTFFNLRPRGDVGAHLMPGARDEMIRRAGRSRHAHLEVGVSAGINGAQVTFLIDLEEDGLCAFSTVAGPGTEFPQEVVGGAGRYELLLAGSFDVDDVGLPNHSLLFAHAGEQLPKRRAGTEGVQVLTLQAPTN